MKKGILLFVNILFCGFVIAQPNYDFKTLVGNYDGYPYDIDKDSEDKTIPMKVELSADYSLILKFKTDGEWKGMNAEKLKPNKATLAKNGSLQFVFNPAGSNKDISHVDFNVMPTETGFNGVFLSLVDKQNKTMFFLLSKQGGNPTIPKENDGLSSGGLDKKLHQQMTSLFSDLEKGFTLSNGTRKKGYTTYPSRLYIKGLTNGNLVYVFDNGLVYFYANVLSFKNSNSYELVHINNIENAIKSYSNSNGFQISALTKDKNYVVKKSGKTIGFFEIKKSDKSWNFYLHKPLDSNKLKTELTKGLELAENNFEKIKGGEGDFTFVGKNYKSTRDFYGASSSKINITSKSSNWISSFNSYPYAALLYQIENMNFSYAGAIITDKKINKKGLTINFSKQNKKLAIYLLDYEKEAKASLWILNDSGGNKINNRPTTSAESKGIDFSKINTDVKEAIKISNKSVGNSNKMVAQYEVLMKLKNRNYSIRQNQMRKINEVLREEKNNSQKLGRLLASLRSEASSNNCWEAVSVFEDTKKKTEDISKIITETLKETEYAVKMNYASGFLYPEKHLKEQLNNYIDELRNQTNLMDQFDAVLKKCSDSGESRNQQNKTNSTTSSSNNNSWQVKPNLVSGHKVGLECERTYGKVFVVKKITPGWAGAKAGIRVGDEILEINGTTVQGMMESKMDLLFLGKKGTSVKVKVQKKNDPTPHTYHMIRGEGGSFTEDKAIVIKDEMPPYVGNYEGDDLLKLLGRDVEDKAIKKLISLYDLKRDKSCSYEESCLFDSRTGIYIQFKQRKLSGIFLLYSGSGNGKFSKKTPLAIPLGKPLSLMDSFGKDWERKRERLWQKTINNIEFEIISDPERGIVETINISADKNMDWKAYHQNFDYSSNTSVKKESTFKGEYAGDNLLKLMGREIDDPAIIEWFKNPDFGFQESKHYECTDEFCIYQSEKYGINLRFEGRKLTQFSFYNHKKNYKITTPFNVPVGKSLATFKPKSKGFIQGTGLQTNFWRKEDVKFIYTITTDRKTKAIEWFTIYGEK